MATTTATVTFLKLNFNGSVDPCDLSEEQKAIADGYPEKMTRAQSKQLKTWLQEAIAIQAEKAGIEVKLKEYSAYEFTYYYSYSIAIDVIEYQDEDLTAAELLRRLPKLDHLDPIYGVTGEVASARLVTELGSSKLVQYNF